MLSSLGKISHEIDDLKAHNVSKLSETKSNTKIKLLIEKEFLCYQMVMNKIKSNPLYSSNLFYVQPHDDTLKKFEKEGIETAHNMWLAIRLEGMSVLKPSTRATLFEIQYNEVDSKKVYPSSVIFVTYTSDEYRFNTYQSFEISQLVEYNKILNETLGEMAKDRNEEMMVKTKLYIKDIQSYRNSQG